MRNLKRALSLALASVMLMGMMVVGTSASYKDVDADKYNAEAIEVLQATKIMVGDENGNFNPDNLVTRQEMAVVMSNLMDYRVSSYAGTCPFGDVADWAEPYVAACFTNEITSGMGANYYGATENVTTSQAALMLMKALGYFQYASDFGADWQLATVKQANKIELFDGVASGVKEAMTRNDLAQLVLNALEAGTVEADNDTIKVEADDVKVEAGSVKYNWLTSGKDYAKAIDDTLTTGTSSASGNTQGWIIQLGEKLYNGNLKKNDQSQATGYNAPATKWTYKSEVIGTYADDYDYIFTGAVKSRVMYNAIGEDASEDYTWNVYLDGDCALDASDETYTSAKFQAAVVADNYADLKNTGRGTTTYVYIDDDKYTVTVCIARSYIAEIVEVEDETITLEDNSLEFDVEGYEEDDVVVYAKSYNGKDWTVEDVLGLATYVEGTVDQVKDVDTVIVDGTTYKYNTTQAASDKISIDSYDQIVGFYLDAQGHIGKVDTAVESGDYAYVISMGQEGDKYGSDDIVIYAKLALVDGTIVKAEIDDDDYVEGEDGKDSLTETQKAFEGNVVSYTVEDNGVYSLTYKAEPETVSLKIEKGTTKVSGLNVYADANTVYLMCEDAKDDEYVAYTGYKNVPDIEGKVEATAIVKKGIAKLVFIGDGATTKTSADDIIFVVGRNNEKVIKNSVGNYFEYKAIVKGETTTIKVKEGSDAQTAFEAAMGVTEGKKLSDCADKQMLVFAGLTENSKGLVTDLEAWSNEKDEDVQMYTYTGSKRLNANSGLVGFAYNTKELDYDVWYGVDDGAIVAYYEPSGNTLSAVGTIDDLKTDTNDGITVIVEEGAVIAVLAKIAAN